MPDPQLAQLLAFLKFLSRPAARARWEAAGLELAAEPAAAFAPGSGRGPSGIEK